MSSHVSQSVSQSINAISQSGRPASCFAGPASTILAIRGSADIRPAGPALAGTNGRRVIRLLGGHCRLIVTWLACRLGFGLQS